MKTSALLNRLAYFWRVRKLFRGFWFSVTTALVATTILPISSANALGAGNCVSTTSGTLVATATQSGSNCIVIFTSGTGTWTLPAGIYSVSYLVVGGGGASSRGQCSVWWGAGGGGGEVISASANLSGSRTVTIGEGGAAEALNCAGAPAGKNGNQTVFGSVTARPGNGGGGTGTGGTSGNLNAGSTGPGGVNGCPSPGYCGAGGGGGASTAASPGTMNAGVGIDSSLSGTSTHYGAGGAGRDNTNYGTSNACAGNATRQNGLANSGCGGSDIGSGTGAGGSGIVVAVYAFDVTAPTFTSSSSFSTAENIATSANAATIKVSESSTVTISSGVDASLFNIVTSDTVTAFIRFKTSPNFEAPSDSGGNNVYDLVLAATDLASNAGTQTITITVTDVVDTSAFNSFALSGSATYRQVVTISANVTVASKVTFRAKNVIIAGCKNKTATGSGSSFTATCSWKPSVRGAVRITATAVPTSGSISSSTANPLNVFVLSRSGSR